MHPIRKLFCRSVQLAFRAALPVLPYRNPRSFDRIEYIPVLLRESRIFRVLLVADGTVRDLGLTVSLERALADHGISCYTYEQRTPNPTIGHVEEARTLYLRSGAQAIIAVGGGSAIDCAKVVGARIARPDKPVQKMRGLLRVLRRTPMLIAVPTTAGTGSEATLTAVVTDAATHHKYPINDFSLIPDYAVLAPELTFGLPPFITATTGMDALTHAVEAYIGRSSNRLTRAMAEEAVTLIAQNLMAAWQDGNNAQARSAMLRASYCAGLAFSRSYVGYVHGVAHSLGGQYGIAHGLANAVLLPRVLRAYGSACEKKLAALSRRAGVAAPNLPDEGAAEAFIRWIETLNRTFSLPQTFDEIRAEDIPLMARNADRECNPLYPVPMLMDRTELENIYLSLMNQEVPI